MEWDTCHFSWRRMKRLVQCPRLLCFIYFWFIIIKWRENYPVKTWNFLKNSMLPSPPTPFFTKNHGHSWNYKSCALWMRTALSHSSSAFVAALWSHNRASQRCKPPRRAPRQPGCSRQGSFTWPSWAPFTMPLFEIIGPSEQMSENHCSDSQPSPRSYRLH